MLGSIIFKNDGKIELFTIFRFHVLVKFWNWLTFLSCLHDWKSREYCLTPVRPSVRSILSCFCPPNCSYHFKVEAFFYRIRVMLFNATFNYFSVISWQSVLLVEETGVHRETHRPVANHWQTVSHNVVSFFDRINVHIYQICAYYEDVYRLPLFTELWVV